MSVKVTCICPCNRPQDIPNVIDCYISQNYDNKELLILNDDGDQSYTSVDNRIFPWSEGIGLTIGNKRNILCSHAWGEIIIHMDSDDYFAPGFITRAVEQLQTCDLTGLSKAYFHKGDEVYLYEYTGSQPYVIGSGMAYWKRVWERKPFRGVQSGEDMHFQSGNIVKPMDYLDGFYATIHDSNTSSHKALPYMKRIK